MTPNPGAAVSIIAAALLTVGLLAADRVLAASRALYGGRLEVAVGGARTPLEPAGISGATDALLASLTATPLCQVDLTGRPAAMLAASEWAGPTELILSLERPLASEVIGALERTRADGRSPYRGLLWPVRALEARKGAQVVALRLSHPWPELESALCHPALALQALGPFSRRPDREGGFTASLVSALGRPFVDELFIHRLDPAPARRSFESGRLHISFAGPHAPTAGDPPAPLLEATYLVLPDGPASQAMKALLSELSDPTELLRFVPAPALRPGPLLPAWMCPSPAAAPPRASVGRAAPRTAELTLSFRLQVAEHRAIAERLQLRLHEAGIKLSLKGVTDQALRERPWPQDREVILHSILLPPAPAAALAAVLGLARAGPVDRQLLAPLARSATPAERAARACAIAEALAAELPVVPLYVRGLPVARRPELRGLTFDGHGIPSLADLSLAPALEGR